MGSPQLAYRFLLYSTNLEDQDGSPKNFDTLTLKGLYDVRAEDGRVTCKLRVDPFRQNRNGTLHGGCIATIVDIVATAALLTNISRGGVSLNINTNYLSAMPGGGVVLIDAKVLRIGRTIAVATVDLIDDATGKLCAQGQHVKFVSESEPDLSKLAAAAAAMNGVVIPPAPLARSSSHPPRSKL